MQNHSSGRVSSRSRGIIRCFQESAFLTLPKAIPLKLQGIVPQWQIVFLVPACLLYMLLVVTVIRRN